MTLREHLSVLEVGSGSRLPFIPFVAALLVAGTLPLSGQAVGPRSGGPSCDLDRVVAVAPGGAERRSADGPATGRRPEDGSASAESCAATVTPPAGASDHDRLAPSVRAVPLEGSIELDGRLDEAAWSAAPAATGFLQRDPEEGTPASQRTEVRFVYGEDRLYVGARMFDDEGPDGVTSRLVRRDSDPKSDQLTLTFDTFLDHQGRTVFSVNPSGVRGDAYGPAGSHPNQSWDPVWSVSTRVDSAGWTAEIEIPFHQLRFPQQNRRWGLQIERTLNRRNETSVWSFWRKDQSGGPSRYGHLEGIRAPSGGGKLEILPYTVTKLDVAGTVDPANPLEQRTDPELRAGADLTYQLSSNLTMNATLNPDFGQVEVDPAVVNLSAVETFFPEKREFFVQGQGIFNFGGIWCIFCSNTSSLNMLHTRRIGRSPQGAALAHGAGEYAEVPDATTILGAAKLTGQLPGGLSVGVLDATTAREHATVVGPEGNRLRPEVEPLSNYFVARAKKDYEDGDLQVGSIFTSVVRDLNDPALESRLSSHSEAMGLDAEYWWGDRTYHLLFSGAVSNVSGSREAIHRLQRSSARYFQRPDREHGGNGLFTDRLDPTLSSMRGYALYARLARDAGDWRWEGFANVRSPGFENNDIAFLTRTDYAQFAGNVMRLWSEPTGWYRSLGVIGGGQVGYNFDGDQTERQVHGFLSWEAPNYWEVRTFGLLRASTLNDRLTRGGPVVRNPRRGYVDLSLTTDTRRSAYLTLNPSTGWNEEGARDWSFRVSATLKPSSNISLQIGPRWSHGEVTDQYVTAVDDPTAEAFYGRRYVFADLEQQSLAMETRLDWTFSPTMSLELFAQPFLSSNAFSRYKEFAAPRRLEKVVYGEDRGTVTEETVVEGGVETRMVRVDPDGTGPAETFSFADRDFTFRSLRGNAVFRWEYLPGSTLFFVWTQDRSATDGAGDFALGRDLDRLFTAPADNVFMVKATYWIGL